MSAHEAQDPRTVEVAFKARGYGVYKLPEECIGKIRELLAPRPAKNVIIFMCIGLGRKETEIVEALKDEFDIFPIGIDIEKDTYAVIKSTKEFPILKFATNKSLEEVITFHIDNGIVVGFNMINMERYWRKNLMYYDWPLVYNISNIMYYDKKWSDYVEKQQPEYLAAKLEEDRKKYDMRNAQKIKEKREEDKKRKARGLKPKKKGLY